MTTILLVDDHEVVRKGIRQLLGTRPDWQVCGEAATGLDAITAISTLNPDLIVLDVSMPGMSGIETTKRIRELGLKPRIVIFTMHESQELVAEARKAGADGCVRKSQAGRDLVTAIDSVLSGGTFFVATKQPDQRPTVTA